MGISLFKLDEAFVVQVSRILFFSRSSFISRVTVAGLMVFSFSFTSVEIAKYFSAKSALMFLRMSGTSRSAHINSKKAKCNDKNCY